LKPDEDLMRGIARGSEADFVDLYRRHQSDLFRFAWHMTGSPETAEEAVQETFLALMKRPEGWREARGPARAYLFGIARNQVLRQIGGRREFDALDEDPAGGEDLLDGLERGERIAAVKNAVRSLPGTYREVTVLCDLEEHSYEDAAQLLGCPVGTVRSRLSRARRMLESKLRAGLLEKVK
jgi:RNA polymerase sigma-70 factor (ECF subfamily)